VRTARRTEKGGSHAFTFTHFNFILLEVYDRNGHTLVEALRADPSRARNEPAEFPICEFEISITRTICNVILVAVTCGPS
jgi:hypothetical protein